MERTTAIRPTTKIRELQVSRRRRTRANCRFAHQCGGRWTRNYLCFLFVIVNKPTDDEQRRPSTGTRTTIIQLTCGMRAIKLQRNRINGTAVIIILLKFGYRAIFAINFFRNLGNNRRFKDDRAKQNKNRTNHSFEMIMTHRKSVY